MARRPASLRRRLTLVMLAIVAVAVLVTGAVTVPLVRTSTTQGERSRLAEEADLLAGVDRVPSRLAAGSTFVSGSRFAVVEVPPAGRAAGAAASYVTPAVRAALESRGTYSGTLSGALGRALVEGRATVSGSWLVSVLPVTEVDNALNTATRRVLLGLLVGLLAAGVAALSLARWLTRPLTETAHAARRLAAGERGVALPAPASQEAAELTAALSALDQALATSEGRQREFLLAVSHEMRTPLAAVRGYAEALSDGMVGTDEVPLVGRTLVRETERLDAFVRDLLELARLQADDFTVHPVPVDVPVLLEHVRTAWSARAASLEVTLSVDAGDVGGVVADPQRLRQVLDGLVENALRATPASGGVAVTARSRTGGYVFEVADTGPGLAADDLAVAFERGTLHAKYRQTRPVGTGLGLSIAARLVTRMGGTLSVANTATGALFTVSLPTS
ncbi:MAG TPA: HAMP domain-containing sensor histidine kinase [Propionibacteriaceae bacterium]|nr:HAMP domain-containing sensor histidine kinase [Propionibacteriaceae bacterium]